MTGKISANTGDVILDTEMLLHICEGDLDFLKELINLFIDDSNKLLTRIEKSIKLNNYSNLCTLRGELIVLRFLVLA